MKTNTSTEENGKKKLEELKITRTNEADKLIDEYFNFAEKYPDLKSDLKEDAEYVLSTHSITFETKEQTERTQGGEENENKNSFTDAINVLQAGKRDFILEEIARGAGINIKLADLRKVKAKTTKIRKEEIAKKAEKVEKTENTHDSEGR